MQKCPKTLASLRLDNFAPHRRGGRSQGSRKDSNVKCFKCGKEGHFSRNCPTVSSEPRRAKRRHSEGPSRRGDGFRRDGHRRAMSPIRHRTPPPRRPDRMYPYGSRRSERSPRDNGRGRSRTFERFERFGNGHQSRRPHSSGQRAVPVRGKRRLVEVTGLSNRRRGSSKRGRRSRH